MCPESSVRMMPESPYTTRHRATCAELARWQAEQAAADRLDTAVENLRTLAAQREQLTRQLEHTTEALRAACADATAAGISEAETARLAGVTRMTVRAWLGK